MVVLVDLDEDAVDEPSIDEHYRRRLQGDKTKSPLLPELFVEDDRPNLNLGGFSAALACYPYDFPSKSLHRAQLILSPVLSRL